MTPAPDPGAPRGARATEGNHPECDVLVFAVADQEFAADPLDVRRIGKPDPELPRVVIRESSGTERVLVVETAGGSVQVPVDRVMGLRRVRLDCLLQAPTLLHEMIEPSGVRLVGALVDPPPDDVGDLRKTGAGARTAEHRPTLVLDLRAMTALGHTS